MRDMQRELAALRQDVSELRQAQARESRSTFTVTEIVGDR